MKKILIRTKNKNYPVFLGSGIFGGIGKLISEHKLSNNIFVIVDSNLYKLHKRPVDQFLINHKGKKSLFIFSSHEVYKSYLSLNRIYEQLIAGGFNRDTLIVAIGGGITGDLAGYAAATFTRGVQLIHVPTTLLAMVDSSIGGKTGINFGSTKNIVGAFYQPEFVLADLNFLKTLPRDEIICGIGEIVKYSFLMDDNFFSFVKSNLKKLYKLEGNTLDKVIENCILFKGKIVEQDELETSGLRKILNLGHTFAHALEVEQEHQIKHGQAVITGLSCALHLSNKLNLLDDDLLAKYLSLLIKFDRDIVLEDFETDIIYDAMKRDKKNKEEKIKFVLMRSAGSILIDIDANKDDVIYSIKNGLQYFT
ncbi:MAG: 3-dehydroquinate synthase [Bacteroidota bacterium]